MVNLNATCLELLMHLLEFIFSCQMAFWIRLASGFSSILLGQDPHWLLFGCPNEFCCLPNHHDHLGLAPRSPDVGKHCLRCFQQTHKETILRGNLKRSFQEQPELFDKGYKRHLK